MANLFSRYGIYFGAEGNPQTGSLEAEADSKEREGGLAGHLKVFLKSNRSQKCILVITDLSTFYLIKSVVTY